MDLQRREFEVLCDELEFRSQDCGISQDEMSVLIGAWPISASEGGEDVERAARRFYELLGLARWLFGQDASEWLRKSNTALGGVAPLTAMLTDRRSVMELRDRLRSEITVR